jgi:hypothetical protein
MVAGLRQRGFVPKSDPTVTVTRAGGGGGRLLHRNRWRWVPDIKAAQLIDDPEDGVSVRGELEEVSVVCGSEGELECLGRGLSS